MTKITKAALTRRSLLAGASAGLLATRAWAQNPAEVKVGLLVPLSGIYARPGAVMLKGAEMAIDASTPRAASRRWAGPSSSSSSSTPATPSRRPRMRRSAWWRRRPTWSLRRARISSFTLAVTEVTERAGLPC